MMMLMMMSWWWWWWWWCLCDDDDDDDDDDEKEEHQFFMMNIWPRPFSAAQFSSQVHVCSEADEDPGAGEKILGSGPQDPWGSHEFCWKTYHGGPWNHSETIPLRRPRLLERMGLENLLLVVSHWNSGANMGKLRHPSLVHFSFQCLNSFLENMRWNRICSEANLRCSKIQRSFGFPN